eukprot:CAMPEP_0116984678 /NCGR_PEP_ID=MMETSP0467-20121206/61759_1 /TAXON_ID=283647 /ORGANISM="Mesodinium pulex, Strain SPMC105" /LENGTH=218 /DNA_ID=CAMNT_0004679763 /DNA_START=515 /DNA_END=1172 /DNA_ORIENTATION=-
MGSRFDEALHNLEHVAVVAQHQDLLFHEFDQADFAFKQFGLAVVEEVLADGGFPALQVDSHHVLDDIVLDLPAIHETQDSPSTQFCQLLDFGTDFVVELDQGLEGGVHILGGVDVPVGSDFILGEVQVVDGVHKDFVLEQATHMVVVLLYVDHLQQPFENHREEVVLLEVAVLEHPEEFGELGLVNRVGFEDAFGLVFVPGRELPLVHHGLAHVGQLV